MSALMVEGWVLFWRTFRADRRERIAQHAFEAHLREGAAIPILLDHDWTMEVGAVEGNGSGASSVRIYPQGLHFTLRLAAGPVADALEDAVRRRTVTGCSHALKPGYVIVPSPRSTGPCQIITRARLAEISIMTTPPAYQGTSLRAWRTTSTAGQPCGGEHAAAILDHLAGGGAA